MDHQVAYNLSVVKTDDDVDSPPVGAVGPKSPPMNNHGLSEFELNPLGVSTKIILPSPLKALLIRASGRIGICFGGKTCGQEPQPTSLHIQVGPNPQPSEPAETDNQVAFFLEDSTDLGITDVTIDNLQDPTHDVSGSVEWWA